MRGSAISRKDWEAQVLASLQEVGECLEWTGDMTGKVPVVYTPAGFLREGVRGGRQSARIAYWVLQHGFHPGEGMVLSPRCRNPRCMSHLRPLQRGQQVKLAVQEGAYSTRQQQAAAIKARRGRADAKLSIEKAREIRASDESPAALALRFGVSKETVRAVRRGISWVDGAHGASVFSWRPAA